MPGVGDPVRPSASNDLLWQAKKLNQEIHIRGKRIAKAIGVQIPVPALRATGRSRAAAAARTPVPALYYEATMLNNLVDRLLRRNLEKGAKEQAATAQLQIQALNAYSRLP